MARSFTQVSATLWDSDKLRSLPTAVHEHFYIYLLTHERRKIIGCYTLKRGYMIADLQHREEDYKAATGASHFDQSIDLCLEALEDAGLIQWNPDKQVIYLENFTQHSPICNKNHARGAIKQALELPDCKEKDRIIEDLNNYAQDGDVEALPAPPKKPKAKKTKPRQKKQQLTNDDDCPHSEVIDLWHQTVPGAPRIREWGDGRKKLFEARWKEYPNIEIWKEVFEMISKSDFLMGRAGGRGWKANLPWVLNAENFTKIMEGNYDNGRTESATERATRLAHERIQQPAAG